MKIGLIIPYKNAAEWLPRCLNSIKGDFKVFLVSDRALTDEHLIAWNWGMDHPEMMGAVLAGNPLGQGVSYARNEGLDEAIVQNCDYITFLDADDELTPDAYDNMIRTIEAEPEAPIIQFNHYMIDKNGWKVPRMQNNAGTYDLGHLPKLWVSSVNKLFKTELVKNIRFNEQLRHGEDELFILECLATARRIYCSKLFTMIYHRDNPNSLSKSTTLDDVLDEQSALYEFIIEHSDDVPLRNAVRIRNAELWDNAVYRRVFGGAK